MNVLINTPCLRNRLSNKKYYVLTVYITIIFLSLLIEIKSELGQSGAYLPSIFLSSVIESNENYGIVFFPIITELKTS